ncbi:hypothetical protein [Microvirga alba]|uniref:Uncharacterized protein n=1 Tax=Microvirga alba TaxID=2791025 RepID=A0A931BSU6_9HYPH|nr:hypothetical protein [Microvirga alba]MBF9233170.1 hypothetical protein [Microvirga alba]
MIAMKEKPMTLTQRIILAAAILTAFGLAETGNGAVAMPRAAPVEIHPPHLIPAQLPLFELFSGDDEPSVHDRHYDWNQYRNSTSRKERIRDYYRMQKEAEKDYWRAQKNMQKNMIKRQRGW